MTCCELAGFILSGAIMAIIYGCLAVAAVGHLERRKARRTTKVTA